MTNSVFPTALPNIAPLATQIASEPAPSYEPIDVLRALLVEHYRSGNVVGRRGCLGNEETSGGPYRVELTR